MYYNWRAWNGSQRFGKWVGSVENQWTNRGYSGYNVVEISQNTENCHGDLRRLAVTHIPVKDHPLRLALRNRET